MDNSGKGICIDCGLEYEHRNWEGRCEGCIARKSLKHDPLALQIYERISLGGNAVVMAEYIANQARQYFSETLESNADERLIALADKISEALADYNAQHPKMGE